MKSFDFPWNFEDAAYFERLSWTTHMGRVVNLPAQLARPAFLALVDTPKTHDGPIDRTQLVLSDDPNLVGEGPFMPMLARRATLHRRWRRWAVDLELNPWSDSACEVALRLRSNNTSPRCNDPMFVDGHTALETICTAMLSWIDQLTEAPVVGSIESTQPSGVMVG